MERRVSRGLAAYSQHFVSFAISSKLLTHCWHPFLVHLCLYICPYVHPSIFSPPPIHLGHLSVLQTFYLPVHLSIHPSLCSSIIYISKQVWDRRLITIPKRGSGERQKRGRDRNGVTVTFSAQLKKSMALTIRGRTNGAHMHYGSIPVPPEMDYCTTSFRVIKMGLGLKIHADKTEEILLPELQMRQMQNIKCWWWRK